MLYKAAAPAPRYVTRFGKEVFFVQNACALNHTHSRPHGEAPWRSTVT